MRVLAIDTSTSVSAVAVLDGARVLAEDHGAAEGRHGEVLLLRVKSVLGAAGLAPRQLELIAVGIGPGSFTGLRVGLASAKGLAIALSLPVRAVCSLRALAAGMPEPMAPGGLRVVACDAGKGEVFVAAFGGPTPALEPSIAPLRASAAEAAVLLCALAARAPSPPMRCGSGSRRYAGLCAALGPKTVLLDPSYDVPRGSVVGGLALSLLSADGPSDLATLEPSYLRDSDAKLPARALAL